ncbi:LysR family transcriptional regulator [Massilia niastensis]|uniref:LysR family transcriptional regulator n=1 Tax=Massilia niastensis TaxID=544911 RepID=UPI00035CBFB8|nr:LysR family transcriptional regulator [Massilia niastensis]
MHDLNDLYFFHTMVSCNGFAAGARHIGVPKSTLSKRVAQLENRLQVRLLERTTRSLRTTDVGRDFYERCQVMLEAAEAAEIVAAQSRTEPQGLVRVSCPPSQIQHMMVNLLPAFLVLYPKVRIHLQVFHRPADLIEDRVDIALRGRMRLETDPTLVVRPLARVRLVLVMSPRLLTGHEGPITVERLAEFPTLSTAESAGGDCWELEGPGDKTLQFHHQPRLFCSDLDVARASAIAGVGLAMLPKRFCVPNLQSGELLHVLPDWSSGEFIVHAVFMSRKGMLPSVRAFIDFLVSEVPKLTEDPVEGRQC